MITNERDTVIPMDHTTAFNHVYKPSLPATGPLLNNGQVAKVDRPTLLISSGDTMISSPTSLPPTTSSSLDPTKSFLNSVPNMLISNSPPNLLPTTSHASLMGSTNPLLLGNLGSAATQVREGSTSPLPVAEALNSLNTVNIVC